VIGVRHDAMDPRHMEMMASKIPRGTYLYCPDRSHLAMYDDQLTYFDGIVDFIRNVDPGVHLGG
jgi:proline iminopeptidase